MAQAGAQREPSMEEILASIRRIIESNDPAESAAQYASETGVEANRHEDVAAALEPVVEQAVAPAAAPVTAPVRAAGPTVTPAIHAAPTAAPARVAPAAPAQEDHAAPAVSLADVAARIRNGAVEQAPAPMQAHEPEVESAEELNSTGENVYDLHSDIVDAVEEEIRQALVSDEPVTPVDKPDYPPHLQDHALEPATASEASAERDNTDNGNPATANPAIGGGQLISLHTGEKVAAAFGELNAAIAAGQARSFDEIAEELLKPMLTQWLDDNLPTLVERLVREEIERVSRGNRG